MDTINQSFSLTQKIFQAAQNGAEIILWLLIATSVVSVALIIERYLTINYFKKHSQRIHRRLRGILQNSSYEDLKSISRDEESLEGRALYHALQHYKKKGAQGIEEVINSFIVMERPHLDRYLNFLATVGSNAPFVGLLGTVLGIMKAFNDLGIEQQASAVMTGIAEALVATAVGLFVAIPAVIAFNHFQKQVKGLLQNLEAVKELCVAYTKSNETGQPLQIQVDKTTQVEKNNEINQDELKKQFSIKPPRED